MTGKEILLETLRSHSTPRTPWVPFVGVHGGHLLGMDASTYLKSADALVAGAEKGAYRYQADGIPVSFDLQLEAEVLGCDLVWAEETPPSVASHPLGDDYDFNSLPEFSLSAGRFPIVLEATRRLKKSIGHEVALYGLITGPLTLALHLRGESFLLDLFDEVEGVERLMDFCSEIGVVTAEAFIEAGVDVVAVVDPMISQISPGHFESAVAGPLNRIFDAVREAGALSSLFVCGNATRNIEPMAATRCDNISVDENVDLQALAKACRSAGKSFGGNLKLTTVLLLGEHDDVCRETIRCLDAAGEGPGYVLAPGCDLPYGTKPANLETVAKLVHDAYQRDVARALPEAIDDDTFEDVVIPDYAEESAVIVDVVTLDSAGCAPCAYMMKAAEEAARCANGEVLVREHKITGRDGLGYMKHLQVTAIPSICIDGVECFASIIPDRQELVARIQLAAETP